MVLLGAGAGAGVGVVVGDGGAVRTGSDCVSAIFAQLWTSAMMMMMVVGAVVD